MSARLCRKDLDLSKLAMPAMRLPQREGLGSPEEKDQRNSTQQVHWQEGALTPSSCADFTISSHSQEGEELHIWMLRLVCLAAVGGMHSWPGEPRSMLVHQPRLKLEGRGQWGLAGAKAL